MLLIGAGQEADLGKAMKDERRRATVHRLRQEFAAAAAQDDAALDAVVERSEAAAVALSLAMPDAAYRLARLHYLTPRRLPGSRPHPDLLAHFLMRLDGSPERLAFVERNLFVAG